MVNTRKTTKTAVKTSPEPKQAVKVVKGKPQIPKSKKPKTKENLSSKIPKEKKASPLDDGTATMPAIKVTDEGVVGKNPISSAVDHKRPEPAAKQKMVPSQSLEGTPKPIDASSTSTRPVPSPITSQSKVISSPKALVTIPLHVKDTVVVGDNIGEVSRADVSKDGVGVVKEGEPSKHVSKVSIGSRVWREKIHASGYVRTPQESCGSTNRFSKKVSC
ncbi:unnamed protein product [Rhodiola kirilowii]